MTTASYDTRKYECCAPYYGEVGQEFTRRFRPEFEGALHSQVDDFASLYDHVVLQSDPGAPGVAHAGPPAAQALSQRAYERRQKKSFGLIRRHVEDPALRDDIDANAMGDGPSAWQIIIAAGTAQQTFLNLSDQDSEWHATTFADVGYDERTLPNFRALLDRLNRERPVLQRKSNIEVWQKILHCVRLTGHAELKMKATDQMQTPTLLHPPGHPLVGQPDVGQTVLQFAERWRTAITDGSIRRQAPRKQVAPTGNRVDGMVASLASPVCPSVDDDSHIGAFVYLMRTNQIERICWNCKGLGHLAKDSQGNPLCPSPALNRTYATCIQALEQARKREGNKKQVRFVRRRTPSSDARVAEATDVEIVTFEVDTEGHVFDSTGSMVADQLPAGAVVEPAEPDDNYLQTVDGKMASIPDENDGSKINEHYTDEDFESAFISQGLLSDCSPANTPAHPTKRFAFCGIVACITVACMLTVRKAGPAARFLALAGLGLGASSSLPTNGGAAPAIIDASFGAVKVRSSSDFNPRNGAAIDTGATKHASGRVKLFPRKHIVALRPNLVIEIANNSHCPVEFIGSMLLPVHRRASIQRSTKKRVHLLVSDALYVPALRDITLLSPKALFANEGIRTYFNDACFFRTPTGHIYDFVETERLYILPFHDEPVSPAMPVMSAVPKPAVPSSVDHLHAKFNHHSIDSVIRSQHCLVGIDFSRLPIDSLPKHQCDACIRASMRRHAAPLRTGVKYTRFAQCICSDTCDMGVYSIPFGFRYFVTFLDMATRYLFVYFLRTHAHAEVRQIYLQFMADAKPFMPKGYVELWFMDNGTEFNVSAGVGKDKPGYFANTTDAWLAEYFTRRRFIVPWNPQENPAESSNRILLGPARAALLQAKQSPRYWPFTIHQTVIIHNAMVNRSANAVHVMIAEAAGDLKSTDTIAKPLSPFTMLHGKPFNARFLEPLFCLCHCKIRNVTDLAALSKPEARSTPAIHLGLDPRRQGYFVYLIEYQRFTTSAFFDTFFPQAVTYPPFAITGEVSQEHRHRLPTEEQLAQQRPLEPREIPRPMQDDNDTLPDGPTTHLQAQLPSGNTRSARQQVLAGLSAWYVPGFTPVTEVMITDKSYALLVKNDIWRPLAAPSTTAEAMQQDRSGWIAAYEKDFAAKLANGAFVYWPRPPPGVTVHPVGWAHKINWHDDNTIDELRARFVGKGFRQKKGIDFAENYSSTPRLTSIRIFLAIMVAFKHISEHCDVIKAFTQNRVTDVEHLFVEQPPMLPVVRDAEGKAMVIKCIMALEGLRQSGHLHQTNHSGTFTSANDVAVFTQLECEPTIFVFIDGDESIFAVVWTDDVLFSYSHSAAPRYERFLKEVYGKRWNFKRKGPVKTFAGIQIERDDNANTVSLSMERYIEGVFQRFVPKGHPVRSSPVKSKEFFDGLKPAADDVERKDMLSKPYLAACACLIWLQSTLRADLAVHVVILCQLMHDPSPDAWEALIDLIAYAHYSKRARITYYADSSNWKCPSEYAGDRALFESGLGMHAFCDSSWKLKSLAGFVIFMAGGAVDWSTKLIKVICHSSAEAEVGSGCIMAKRLVFVRQLSTAMGVTMKEATPCFIDSSAAILIAANVGVTKRTLHFERWQHYLRHCVQKLVLTLIHVPSKRQRADGLTKIVDAASYRWLFGTLFGRIS